MASVPAKHGSELALLEALESLALPEPPRAAARRQQRGPDRFAWQLAPKRGGLEVDVRACSETPRGWREGERIPMHQLPRSGGPDWEALGWGERAALEALAAWNRNPVGLPFALLAALEGHTRLSWAQGLGYASSRVALARELAVLEVREVPGGWQLGLSAPEAGSVRLRLEGDRLLFTGFNGLHRALADLLGAGRVLGRTQGPRLAKVLARLLPHLPLLTDLLPEPAPPEGRPQRSLLVWARGGGERLELRLRVRPGPALPLALPGAGPAFSIAGEPWARELWRRDLLFERGRADQVVALLPPSAKPQAEPLAWRLEGREIVAEVLAGLRDLGARIQLEGIPGLVPGLPEKLGEGDLVLSFRQGTRALEVQGTLKGRPLGSLLPALQKTQRFLEWEPGKVLDLAGLLGCGLKHLAAWGRGEGGAVQLPWLAAPVLRELGVAQGPATSPTGLPCGFKGTLRPYQLEGFQWLARLLAAGLGACLADDMGLGKTVQTAALLAHRAELGPALVVCPTSVAFNWGAELARFTPGLEVCHLGDGDRAGIFQGAGPGQVVLASYGLLLSEAEGLQSVAWATVVLDEAHAIKNPQTRRAQASRQLQAGARLALTGTPVENRPEELASLMGWLLPSAEERFAAADPETLRLLAAPFLLRRRKSEVLTELPPRTDLTQRVELEAVEAAFHKELVDRCRQDALDGSVIHLLAVLMKMRRACAHPCLVDSAYQGPGAKLDLLLDRLETLREEGHRSLVFSQFTDLLDLVQARLVKSGITFRRLDGSMTAKARQRAVADFQAGAAEVFLLSLRAGGSGLNLTAADDVFHLDPWWNPAVEDQASDRAHRMGRTQPVTVHRLIAAGTVEERVLALHAEKRTMIANLLEGRAEAAPLDREVLERLLG